MAELFDMKARELRRDRAARLGPELFLHERAFDECLERLHPINRRFASALLLGCPDAGWPQRLRQHAAEVAVLEPGHQWARAAGTSPLAEEQWRAPAEPFDLIVAVGTLDTVNPLPAVLTSLRTSLRPDSLLIGAMAGGESLPRLRSAMQAADRVLGAAAPHVHPRIEASALAALLSAAGFIMPVVDVDRVRVSYPSLQRLVGDLRRMGATNVLAQRPRTPLLRAAREAAEQAFTAAGKPVEELFEILHFAAWTPTQVGSGR